MQKRRDFRNVLCESKDLSEEREMVREEEMSRAQSEFIFSCNLGCLKKDLFEFVQMFKSPSSVWAGLPQPPEVGCKFRC